MNMKLSKRQKDKPQIVVHNEKSNKVEKYFNFLRRRIVKRFGVKKDIPITTEDYSDLYFEIPLKADGVKTKELTLTISRRELGLLLECPEVHKTLNIKKVLDYYCVLFNEKVDYEFISKLIYVMTGIKTNLKNTAIEKKMMDSEFAKPFVLVYNNWDNQFTFDKYMDTGDPTKIGLRHRQRDRQWGIDRILENARPLRWRPEVNDEPEIPN